MQINPFTQHNMENPSKATEIYCISRNVTEYQKTLGEHYDMFTQQMEPDTGFLNMGIDGWTESDINELLHALPESVSRTAEVYRPCGVFEKAIKMLIERRK